MVNKKDYSFLFEFKKKTKMKKTILIFLIGVVCSCSSNDFTDPNDPKFGSVDEGTEVEGEVDVDVILTVDAGDGVSINPEIFGVNNDWRQIPDATFSNFANTIKGLDFSLMRYPGGWESEFYDWTTNATPGWENTPSQPGASVGTLKSNISNYSIVIPTTKAMNTVPGSSSWNTAIADLKEKAVEALNASNIGDGIVEIGNEWWLQYAGGVSRSQKLEKYVKVAMDLAEHIQSEFPNRSFKLLVNGDYTQPQEFSAMKDKFVKAYQAIDGVALHTYAGYSTATHNISDLERRIIDCANNFNPNKNFVYLSEWMPARDYNDRALYMEAANIIPDMVHIYARAGADAAAYWPPVNSSIPGLGLTNWNFSTVYPVGQMLGELSNFYKGKALKTTSEKFHVAAALTDPETVVLYITGGNESSAKLGVKLENFDVRSIQSVERFVPSDYAETAKAERYKIETSSASLIDNHVVFNINKEGKYQIYKIVLKRE